MLYKTRKSWEDTGFGNRLRDLGIGEQVIFLFFIFFNYSFCFFFPFGIWTLLWTLGRADSRIVAEEFPSVEVIGTDLSLIQPVW
jgi:hypothetical protein